MEFQPSNFNEFLSAEKIQRDEILRANAIEQDLQNQSANAAALLAY